MSCLVRAISLEMNMETKRGNTNYFLWINLITRFLFRPLWRGLFVVSAQFQIPISKPTNRNFWYIPETPDSDLITLSFIFGNLNLWVTMMNSRRRRRRPNL